MSEDRAPRDTSGGEDLEDLYEHAPCGYLSMDPAGRICKVNATLLEWLGFEREKLVGRRFSELLNIAGRIYFETHFAPLLRMQGFFHEVALDLVTRDGQTLAVLANAAERRDAQGSVMFTRLTIFRATDRRRYERQLLEARAAANKARIELDGLNQELARKLALTEASEATIRRVLDAERINGELREQFIAVLGHDLRTPLSAILNGLHILQREPLSEAGRATVGMMERSSRRISDLIANLLDFARGRLGGGISLDRTRDDGVQDTLEHVVAEARAGAPSRVIETDIDVAGPVVWDRTRVAQLVSNLVANAVTHGAPEEPIRVAARMRDGILEISVINGGDPIPLAAREQLFQPFFRAQVRESQQGLGLGLYIAAQVAEAHGGTLTVDSTDAETRFTFRMPQSAQPSISPTP